MALSKDRLAVCSWSLQPADAGDLVEKLGRAGVKRAQLALTPLVDGTPGWEDTASRLAQGGVEIVSGMLKPTGEDYATLATIRATGGVVVDATWEANQRLVESTADAAAALGLKTVSFHVGFIPEDPAEAGFAKLVDRLRWAADAYGGRGIDLLLETGQERAEGLNRFLDEVDRANVGVNFDPANMILYGMGDPIAAMRQLMPRVRQVHIKDAKATDAPGTWGTEVRVGDGDVDWPAFVAVLEEADYAGNLVIEREAGTSRIADVAHAAGVILQAGR